MRRLVVFGAGELGGRVARLWRAAGGEVLAATRTESRHAALRSEGIDVVRGLPIARLRADDALLLALAGTAAQLGAVRGLIETAAPARAVLVSSTGFHAGNVGVQDERSTPGGGERAQAIAACERAFHQWAGDTGVVLRCGGLYRAGRGPLSFVRSRGAPPGAQWTPIGGPPDRALALVHYDDAAHAACTALTHPTPERVYLCVSDPVPTRAAFFTVACATLGLPPPRLGPSTGVEPLGYDVCRLRRDLLPEPAHPDWTEAARA